MPSTTVAFRVCPDGNDAEDSHGGTASDLGGRARPTRSLPSTVMSTDPAAAMAISTTGSHERRFTARTVTTTTAMTGIPTVPPRSVNRVTHSSAEGVRDETAASSTGWSSTARSSLSTTAS